MSRGYAVILLSVVFTHRLPAFANNVPGIQSMSALLLMPLCVVLFTALAGGYHILHRDRSNRLLSWLGTILGCAILILASTTPEIALIVVGVFGWRAVSRALEMLAWANNALPGEADRWPASKVRFRSCAVALVLTSAFLVGTFFNFLVPWYAFYKDDLPVSRFVRYQLGYAQNHRRSNGKPYFDHVLIGDDKWKFMRGSWAREGYSVFTIQYGPNDETFTILSTPAKVPPFPFNWLGSRPTLRANETGSIRMAVVHNNGQECPTDAPIVRTFTTKEALTLEDLQARQPWSEYEESSNRVRRWANGEIGW